MEIVINIISGILSVVIVIGLLWVLSMWVDGGRVKSPTPIAPELEITVKDGVVDTTYIYKLKED